jgi:hypothetical protein
VQGFTRLEVDPVVGFSGLFVSGPPLRVAFTLNSTTGRAEGALESAAEMGAALHSTTRRAEGAPKSAAGTGVRAAFDHQKSGRSAEVGRWHGGPR